MARPRLPPLMKQSRSSSGLLAMVPPPARRSKLGGVSSGLRKGGAGSSGGCGNIMDFFKNMDSDLQQEGDELQAEARVLQDHLRMHRKAGREVGALGNGRRPSRPGSATGDRGFGYPSDPLLGARRAHFRKSGSCGALPPPIIQARRPGRAEWELHDEEWERFHESAPDPLYVEMVPWPPCNDDILEFYELLKSEGDRKRAYREACRRWHPDKFLQRYGSAVPAGELKYMTFRVNEVFQAITSQWELTK
eukprot:TRINITY_DN92_c1_g3_i1.p1 TRINITY_DN92_c1_g3~~TRINITY_DN92_c1_g3_i1.p1  ORF type:complete len:249 (-),score=55.42 TRINITY_DN92_c1_g3_i1:51-797(-)